MNIVELDTVGSTNDHAKNMARDGAPAGTVVFAHEQTAGRGRQGNVWVSLRGNLFMSLILRPAVAVADRGQLSFLSAVALATVLETVVPATVRVSLKWPNDVLLNGKKAAGILIEAENDFAIVGIGVNIVAAPEHAVSLQGLGVKSCDILGNVLEPLVREIEALVEQWEKNGFQDIRAAWLARAHKLGGEMTARLQKETLVGTFGGLDMTGALQLRLPDGTLKTISSGEVFI